MKRHPWIATCTVLLMLGLLPAQSTPRTWGGGSDGDWFIDANWNPEGVPETGDTVLIDNGSVILTNATAVLSDLTIANATLTFTNWATALTATTITIESGGILRHDLCDIDAAPDVTNRICLVTSNITVAAGGLIDASAHGFAGRYGANGQGEGGGTVANNSAGGGGYGGKGGRGHGAHGSNYGGPAYGRPDIPLLPGSAGGGANGTTKGTGGAGGGLIWIEATGRVQIEGTLRSNGGTGMGGHSGGGSGGGIYIACQSLAGNGLIEARGGNRSGEGGGGGGGRISILFDPAAQALEAQQPTIVYSAFHATIYQTYDLDAGTVYLNDPVFLPDTLASVFPQKTYLYGITAWSPDNLVVSNTTILFSTPGIELSVTNTIRVTTAGGLSFNLSNSTVQAGGDILLTNSATLTFLQTGLVDTNGAVWTNHAARVEVGGDLIVNSGCTLFPWSHPTNGGSIRFLTANFRLAAGGLVDGNNRGFAGGRHPDHGFGFGGGRSTSTRGGGGGYGGKGGNANNGTLGGGIYGDPDAPVWPGSGAGGGNATGLRGGGLLWIEAAGDIVVDGTIRVNGTGSAGDQNGGGSGGGIFLVAPTLLGNGSMQAIGGGTGSGNSGGGGGGRIALTGWTADRYHGTFDVSGGKYWSSGDPGTIRRLADPAYPHLLTVAGQPARYAVSTPYDYGVFALDDGADLTNTIALIADETDTTRFYCLGYSLTNLSGIVSESTDTQAVFTVTGDLWLTWHWTNQWYLETTAAENGFLLYDRTGWYHHDATVTVRAVASSGHTFLQWSGTGVPPGQVHQNPLILTLDRARSVQALFASTTPQTRVWNGTAAWISSTNWTPEGIPSTNDTVILQSGVCTIRDPVAISAITVSNDATLLFENWHTILTAADINILSNGVITHALTDLAADPQATNRVALIGNNLVLAAGGLIDGDGRGFRGGYGGSGQGPGGGGLSTSGTIRGGGGGHGGTGGGARQGTTPTGIGAGASYGQTDTPILPGSGGAGIVDNHGGNGGGAVFIQASGSVLLDGVIGVNGAAGTSRYGGGAGGSVWIQCQTLHGNGEIRADGHRGGNSESGGGGGGRIALAYDPQVQASIGPQPTIRFSAAPGTVSYTAPQEGTLYLPDAVILPDTPTAILDSDLRVHGVSNWISGPLTVSTHAVFFEEPGFTLTVGGDLRVDSGGHLRFRGGNVTCHGNQILTSGSRYTMLSDTLASERLDLAGDLWLDSGHWTYQFGYEHPNSLLIGGSITLTNTATLTVRGGPTNGIPAAVYGGVLDISGRDLTIPTGCTLRTHAHPTNGGTVKIMARNLTIDGGGLIDANGGGFAGARTGTRGYGPGSGYGDNNSAGGAGYGGVGGKGNHANAHGGPVYGDLEHPLLAGSAGGCLQSPQGQPNAFYIGGAGGGLVWLDIERTLRLDGSITANGRPREVGNGGGGSGGAIYIVCYTFDGGVGGVLHANGSNANSEGGAGGGGRIAVWRVHHRALTTDINVDTGTTRPGAPGTIFWGQVIPPAGSMLMIR